MAWLSGRVTIPVDELSSVWALRTGRVPQPTFTRSPQGVQLDARDLAVAIVRSSLVRAPTRFEYLLSGLASWLQVQFLLQRNSRKLLLTPDLTTRLRDSDRTAIAGKLGAALAYLLVQRYLELPIVVDFDAGCDALNRPPSPPGTSAPDYIAGVPVSTRLDLVEAKGSLLAASAPEDRWWRAPARKGIRLQCPTGRLRLGYQGSDHVFCSGLREPGSQFESRSIHVDPKKIDLPEFSNHMPLIRLHYATWAATSGNLNLAEALLGEQARHPPAGIELEVRGRRYLFPEANAETRLPGLVPRQGRALLALRVAGRDRRVRSYFNGIRSDLLKLLLLGTNAPDVAELLSETGSGTEAGFYPDGTCCRQIAKKR
jgi:hypothetical protein